jgi:hypothetical protein
VLAFFAFVAYAAGAKGAAQVLFGIGLVMAVGVHLKSAG